MASSIGWKARLSQFDLPGTIVFLPMIVCLLLALQWGGSKYEWSNGHIIALFVLFGVLLICFVAIQLKQGEAATIPPRLLKQRTVASAAWFSLALGSSFFIFIFYTPIWFQAIKGATAVQSGIRNLPMLMGVVVFSIVGGILVTMLGHYVPFVIASTVLASIGAGLLTTLKVDTGHAQWIGYQVVSVPILGCYSYRY